MYKKGQIVYIHLSGVKMTVNRINYTNEFQEYFIGGRGFNTALLYFLSKEQTPPESAFDKDNVICISSGLLSGTIFPSSGRTTVSIWKSPVTGSFCDGNLGGHFGPALRTAGIDMLVIDGKLDVPGYITIYKRGDIHFKTINHSEWMLGNLEILQSIKAQRERGTFKEYETLSIGTAGANKVFAATVQCKNRVAGGGGVGAVFGSKFLKAIAVEYDQNSNLEESHPFKFKALTNVVNDRIENHPVFKLFSEYGTTSLIEIHEGMKYLPTNNWTKSTFKKWTKISGKAVMKVLKTEYKDEDDFNAHMDKFADEGILGCRNCPIVCSNMGKIEYETLNCLGAKIGVDDLKWLMGENRHHMNQPGLDVIQSTSIISALMEMYEKKISDYPFKWGDKYRIETFLHNLIYKIPTTAGAMFADGFERGMRRAIRSEKIKIDIERLLKLCTDQNHNSYLRPFIEFPRSVDHLASALAELITTLFFVHVKNMGVSGVVPSQKNKGVALAVATSTRGGDHLRSLPTLAAYASWYMRSNPIKKIWKLLNTNIRMLLMMKSEAKNIAGNLWETYEKTFGVPNEIVNEWKELGFLTNPKLNNGWGSMIKFTQEVYAVSDALSTCRFVSPWRFGIGPELSAEAVMYLTGLPTHWKILMKAGARINAMEKELQHMYNKVINDNLSPKFFVGKGALTLKDFDEVKTDYYRRCGYDDYGRPTSVLMYQLLYSKKPNCTTNIIINHILEERRKDEKLNCTNTHGTGANPCS